MGSLRDCLKKLNMADTPDARYLSKLAKDYEAEGLGRDEAIARAVAERISGSRLEQKSILEQVQKQAGKNPALLKKIFPQGLDLPANLDEIDEQITSASSPNPVETAADLPTPTSAAVPPVNDIPPAKPPDAPAVKVEDDAKTYGITKRKMEEADKLFGFDPEKPIGKRSLESIKQAARAEGHVARADEIAEEAINGKLLSVEEQAAVAERFGKSQVDYERTLDLADAAKTAGNEAESARLTQEALDIKYRGERLRKAGEVIANQRGLGLVAQKIGVRDDMSFANVEHQAEKIGGKLSTEERAAFRKEVKEYRALEEKLEVMEARYKEQYDRAEKLTSQKVFARESQIGERIRRQGAKAKEKILADRASIKEALRKTGLQVNIGLDPNQTILLSKLAISYMREGAATLDEVIKLTRADIPDVTERQVRDAIVFKKPSDIRKLRSKAAADRIEIMKQARLLNQIEDLSSGIAQKTGRVMPDESQTIKQLRKQVADLRLKAYGDIHNDLGAAKFAKLEETFNSLQDQLENHHRLLKKGDRLPSADFKEMQDNIAKVKKMMRLVDKNADLDEQLRTGDFKIKPETIDVPIPQDMKNMQIQVRMKQRRINQMQVARQPWTKGRVAKEVFNITRLPLVVGDMSGIGRQNIWFTLARPWEAPKVIGKATKAYFSEANGAQIDNDLRNTAFFLDGQEAGLAINDFGSALDAGEQRTTSYWIENNKWMKRVGLAHVVKAGNRHMTTLLNVQRQSVWNKLRAEVPNMTPEAKKAFATYINVMTGKGDLSDLKPGLFKTILENAFFSLPLAASRVQAPWAIYNALKHPQLRKTVARDIAGVFGSTAALIGLASAFKAANPDADMTIGDDSRSADYGKLRVGNTRFDFNGGYLGFGRIAINTAKIPFPEDPIDDALNRDFDPKEAFGRFLGYKLHPSVQLALTLAPAFKGKELKDAVGKPTTVTDEMIRSVTPLFLQDIYDAYKYNDESLGMAAAAFPATFTGFGAQTYKDNRTATINKIVDLQRDNQSAKARQLADEWNAANPQDKIQTILSSPLYPKKGGDSFFDRDSQGIKRHYDSTKAEKERKELEKATGATR